MQRLSAVVERQTANRRMVTLNVVVQTSHSEPRELTIHEISYDEAMEFLRELALGDTD